MNILVAYGTTEGHTRKIAEFIAGRVRELGHDTDLVDLSRKRGDANPETRDRIVIAASVHQRGHQEAVGGFVIANRAALDKKPTLFLSVSLSAAFEGGLPEAQKYIDDFLADLEWSPSSAIPVAGALKYDEYDFFKSQIIEHVVLGERFDGGKTDHDFTDWPKLGETVDRFLAA